MDKGGKYTAPLSITREDYTLHVHRRNCYEDTKIVYTNELLHSPHIDMTQSVSVRNGVHTLYTNELNKSSFTT